MDIGAKEIILILFGFVLAQAPLWADRRRRIRSHWAALRVEILLCIENATTLLHDGYMAPLYRLPTTAFEKAFPLLLVEGHATEEDFMLLERFAAKVQEVNRGLEYAAACAQRDDLENLKGEYSRNRIKASALVEGDKTSSGLAQQAMDVVSSKLALGWWRL